MFSDDILIQTADQHGIVDLQKGSIVNDIHKTVKLGDLDSHQVDDTTHADAPTLEMDDY